MSERQPSLNQPEPGSETRQLLDAHNIPYRQWGSGKAKRLEDLESEIDNGDALLVIEDGELLRQVEVVALEIAYEDDKGQRWHLVENRQEFVDGRVRSRKLDASLGEKIKQDENQTDAVRRAIQEELKQEIPAEATKFLGTDERVSESESFPGLRSRYRLHRYDVNFTNEQVVLSESGKPQGYIERQPDKTTYFEWELVDSD